MFVQKNGQVCLKLVSSKIEFIKEPEKIEEELKYLTASLGTTEKQISTYCDQIQKQLSDFQLFKAQMEGLASWIEKVEVKSKIHFSEEDIISSIGNQLEALKVILNDRFNSSYNPGR